jgi:hypothetical protein
MPLFTKVSALLRRKRSSADRTWHENTRAGSDTDTTPHDAARSQEDAYAEAIARILREARSGHASPVR